MRFGHVPDQDLLLSVHGALSPLRQRLTEAHLRRCPPCRQRRQQFVGVSQALAGALRDPSDPPWQLPTPGKFGLWTAFVVIFALLLVLGFSLSQGTPWVRHVPPVSLHSEGRRPDLPNDRCR